MGTFTDLIDIDPESSSISADAEHELETLNSFAEAQS